MTGRRLAFPIAITVATLVTAQAWAVVIVWPSAISASGVVVCTVLSIVVFIASIRVQGYPDWRTLSPAALSYMAAWTMVGAGNGRLGNIEVPKWVWQPVLLPGFNDSAPTGIVVPLVGALIVFALLPRRSVNQLVVASDVLALNGYVLVFSVLPQSGLEANLGGWPAGILLSVLAVWQVVWLFVPRLRRTVRASEFINADPTHVVDVISDLSRRPQWMQIVESVMPLEGGTYLQTVRLGKQPQLAKVRIEERIPARRVTIRYLVPSLLMEEYAVDPIGQGSQVWVTHVCEVSYPLALVGGVWWWPSLLSSRERESGNLKRLNSQIHG